jgi:hypothetical protein
LHANGGRLLQGTKAIFGDVGEVVFKGENSPLLFKGPILLLCLSFRGIIHGWEKALKSSKYPTFKVPWPIQH